VGIDVEGTEKKKKVAVVVTQERSTRNAHKQRGGNKTQLSRIVGGGCVIEGVWVGHMLKL